MFFQLVVWLAKYIGSLCPSEDGRESNQPLKIAQEILLLSMLVWGESDGAGRGVGRACRGRKKDPDQICVE